MSMRIDCKEGTRVRVNLRNGMPHDKEQVSSLLQKNKIYTVLKTEPLDFYTHVYLKQTGEKISFNSVMFDEL